MLTVVVPRKTEDLPRPVPEIDYLELLRTDDHQARCMVALAGSAGLRCMEIANLHTDDIADGYLRVHGKGRRTRLVPMHDTVKKALATHVLEPGWAFPNPRHDGPITRGYVSLRLSRYVKERGMQYTAHQFRHRFATALYRATGDVRLVQAALGHRSIETTMVYVRVAGCDLADAVAKLDF